MINSKRPKPSASRPLAQYPEGKKQPPLAKRAGQPQAKDEQLTDALTMKRRGVTKR